MIINKLVWESAFPFFAWRRELFSEYIGAGTLQVRPSNEVAEVSRQHGQLN